MSKGDRNYIDPARFTEFLLVYQQTRDPHIMDILCRNFFYPLACGVIRRFRFKLVDGDDALQDCVMACVRQVDLYNPEHDTTNPYSKGEREAKAFSFFTACVVNTYKGQFRDEVTNIRRKRKIFDVESETFYRNNPAVKRRIHHGDEEAEAY